jgi:hypothetical protein
MLEKHLLAKIASLKLKDKESNAEHRKLHQRISELKSSRSTWKNKAKESQEELCALRRHYRTHFEYKTPDVPRHKFDLNLMRTCLSLYFLGGCSLRGVKQVLLCIQMHYGIFLGDLPSKSSIDNWVQKVGYDDYMHCVGGLYERDYCAIIDESMVIGKQRMMVVLGVDATKTTSQSLGLNTVSLLYLAVRSTWKASDVEDLFKRVTLKMGKPPLYVISDGCSNLKRGIQDSGLVRICDVGHEIAKWVEQTYKHQEVFKTFSTSVAGVKFREIMKDTAYLLPPKQRAIARFMNLSDTVNWATKILAAMPKMTHVEQQTFVFLKGYKSFIKELADVFDMVNQILKIIKNRGISYENIEKCLLWVKQYTHRVPTILTLKIEHYFKGEKEKLSDETTIWHASSDVIESLFGKFKHRAATNKLNGVTPLVLSLGLYGQFEENNNLKKDKIKNALQAVSMADLNDWKQRYLIDNQVVRRRKMFKI